MQKIGERPGCRRFLEGVTPLRRPESRKTIVAKPGGQVDLIVQIQLALAEVALDVPQRFELETRLGDRVLDRQRCRRNQAFSLRRELAIAT